MIQKIPTEIEGPGFDQFCKNCKKYTVSHNVKEGNLVCKKCHVISDFHYISRENETKNYEDDKEKQKESRVEQTDFHPLYGHDDETDFGDKRKKNQDQFFLMKKNWKEIEKELKDRMRKIPLDIQTNTIKFWYKLCLQRKNEIIAVQKEIAETNSKELKIPQYGIESMRVDAAIAMFTEMKDFTNKTDVLLSRIVRKMKTNRDKVAQRSIDLQNKGILQRTQAKKPIDEALEIGNLLNFNEFENQALKDLSVNINKQELLGGENPKTIGGVMAYIICKHSIKEGLNKQELKDLADLADKAEITLKKYYDDKIKKYEIDILPYWTGRR